MLGAFAHAVKDRMGFAQESPLPLAPGGSPVSPWDLLPDWSVWIDLGLWAMPDRGC